MEVIDPTSVTLEEEAQEEREPWRELDDVDIELAGDRENDKGVRYDGPGIFRVHCDGQNDYVWGASYRQVQNIINALINAPEVVIEDGEAKIQRRDILTVKDVPSLAELTAMMGGGTPPVAVISQRRRSSVEDRMKEEAAENEQAPESIFDIPAVEPHDIADYLDANFSNDCGSFRLIVFQTRAGVTLEKHRTSLLGKTCTYEIWPREAGTFEIGSSEIAVESKRWRNFLVNHFENTKKPVLIDDGVSSYLVVGYRELDPEEDEHPVQYRIIDTLYASRYALRGNRKFKPEEGKDQFGRDFQKDCWVPAEWVEEGRGFHNNYVPGPMWMAFFIGAQAVEAEVEAEMEHNEEPLEPQGDVEESQEVSSALRLQCAGLLAEASLSGTLPQKIGSERAKSSASLLAQASLSGTVPQKIGAERAKSSALLLAEASLSGTVPQTIASEQAKSSALLLAEASLSGTLPQTIASEQAKSSALLLAEASLSGTLEQKNQSEQDGPEEI